MKHILIKITLLYEFYIFLFGSIKEMKYICIHARIT